MSEGPQAENLECSLLVVDDEESIRITLSEALKDGGNRVLSAATGIAALEILERDSIDLVLLDQNLKVSGENGIDVLRRIKEKRPETVVIMMTAYGEIKSAVEATQLGCYQYITKPLEIPQLRLLIKNALTTGQLERQVEFLRLSTERELPKEETVSNSAQMREVYDSVSRIARKGRTTILLRGETGAGKEVVARLIHRNGEGSNRPFVDLNCAAVPESLLESELFGHEVGAFTGATTRRRGLIELADRGTLFLDEIGEMPLNLQTKLLRVMDGGKYRRLGAGPELTANCRFIAATNRDLKQEVEAKRFREDLYYRLSVVPIFVPSLRDRREDLPTLAMHFLARYNKELSGRIERISDKAMEMMANYRWPGNVRQLKNTIERAVLMTTGSEILPEHLPPEIRGDGEPMMSKGADAILIQSSAVVPLKECERAGIVHALAVCGGNKTQAASKLGVSRQTLRTKISEYRILEPNSDGDHDD
ncbi:MAG: sigma-54-dependent Fis family transcriptional regulator [Candidatus Eisenbacteria bacterium]|nr:sigma-54-dependent Fis family transcriptional regulator [Candidatus Eisenbacteria bacterium]MCC7144065.1 sigma-54-dependent Fis family transcriptional regulator [Candidatus Eisenbacteria bacterium]